MMPLPTACACRGTLKSASSAANDRARTIPAARTKARPRSAALRDDVAHFSMITGTSPSDRLAVDDSITTVGSASRRAAGSSLVRRAFLGRPVWDNRRRSSGPASVVPNGASSAAHAEVVILSVDVIVVTYNSAAEVAACLAAVRGSAHVERLIVVDNASSDGSVGAARRAGADLVLENERNVGFARAVNRGLEACAAEYVLLLNPDAELKEPALASMCATMRREAGAAIVAPLLRSPDGTTESGAGRFATLTRRIGLCLPLVGRAPYFAPQYRLLPDVLAAGQTLDVDYAFGAALLLDRAFLVSSGGLDERFFLFVEDEDICRQARAAGRRVVIDTRAAARHVGGASCADEAPAEAQRLFSTYRLFAKWSGRRAAYVYHAGIIATSTLRAAAARAERRPEAAVAIGRMSRLFDDAVRSGVDPLLAPRENAGPATRAGGLEGGS